MPFYGGGTTEDRADDRRPEPDDAAPTAVAARRRRPSRGATRWSPTRSRPSIRDSLREYLDRRLLIIFIFGIASGFPWVLWGSAMTAWLKESGLTRSAIGVFGTVAAAYSMHFLWAPFVDRIPFPLLGRLGQRRGWLIGMQIPLALATLAIAFTHPAESVKWTGILALVIAFCSATQDIAISAYRIEIIPPRRDDQDLARLRHGDGGLVDGLRAARRGPVLPGRPARAGPGTASTCCWPPCGSRS